MYSEKKDVSDYRAFGCRAYVYEDKQRTADGKHTPRAKEAVYVGFMPNMSAWAFWIQEDKKIRASNQVKFDEHEFPNRTRKMMEQLLSDNSESIDILFQQAFGVTCVPFNKLHVSNYRKVHHDKMSYVVVLKVESQKTTYTRAILSKFLTDSNELRRIRDNENNNIRAHFGAAGITHRMLKGLDPRINPDKPPRNFRDAMKALDNQAWAAAYILEYIGVHWISAMRSIQGSQARTQRENS